MLAVRTKQMVAWARGPPGVGNRSFAETRRGDRVAPDPRDAFKTADPLLRRRSAAQRGRLRDRYVVRHGEETAPVRPPQIVEGTRWISVGRLGSIFSLACLRGERPGSVKPKR